MDSFPVAVCNNIRIDGCPIYPPSATEEAFRGYIASKRRYFYGLKMHVLTNAEGQPVEAFLFLGRWASASVASVSCCSGRIVFFARDVEAAQSPADALLAHRSAECTEATGQFFLRQVRFRAEPSEDAFAVRFGEARFLPASVGLRLG